jgi:hypothetical protein
VLSWQAEQLYIRPHDVQTQPMDFLNKIAGPFVNRPQRALSFRNTATFARQQVPARAQNY